MSTEQLAVVGSGPAGISPARSGRDAGGSGEVRLLSADGDPLRERPPLSKDFPRGEANRNEICQADNKVYRELDIEEAVVELDDGQVRTAAGLRHQFTQCALATGAEPTRPDVPGSDHEISRLLRQRGSSTELRETAAKAEETIAVGAGIIGCAATVSLSGPGLLVNVLCLETVSQQQCLGVRPCVELAEKAGPAMGQGRIRTDALAAEHWKEGLTMQENAGRTAADPDAVRDTVPGFWSEISDRTLEYAAVDDGSDRAQPVSHDCVLVGVLTHEAGEDCERGSELVRAHRRLEEAR